MQIDGRSGSTGALQKLPRISQPEGCGYKSQFACSHYDKVSSMGKGKSQLHFD
jgi:hypothetical protein